MSTTPTTQAVQDEILRRGGSATARQIAYTLDCTPSSITPILEFLSSSGWGTWQDGRRRLAHMPPEPQICPQDVTIKQTPLEPTPPIITTPDALLDPQASSDPLPPGMTPERITSAVIPEAQSLESHHVLHAHDAIQDSITGPLNETTPLQSQIQTTKADRENVSPSPSSDAEPRVPVAAESRPREGMAAADRRWHKEGRRADVDVWRDAVRLECRRQGMDKEDAKEFSWSAAIATFPPIAEPQPDVPDPRSIVPRAKPPESEPVVEPAPPDTTTLQPAPIAGPPPDLQGLGAIPLSWPSLPDNAALPTEIAWVQSQRLRIVEDLGAGRTVVHLERASCPAPSHAALGWLETSIRSYAKYVDVVAKSLAAVQDEAESVRRERLSIEEVRSLLREAEAYARRP